MPPRSLRWPGAKPPSEAASAFSGIQSLTANLKTNIYIDDFNLYYGALREAPYRWLNRETLYHLLLPKNTIEQIKYFTTPVSARQCHRRAQLKDRAYST